LLIIRIIPCPEFDYFQMVFRLVCD